MVIEEDWDFHGLVIYMVERRVGFSTEEFTQMLLIQQLAILCWIFPIP